MRYTLGTSQHLAKEFWPSYGAAHPRAQSGWVMSVVLVATAVTCLWFLSMHQHGTNCFISSRVSPKWSSHPPIVTNQLSSTDCHQPIVINQLPPTNCHPPIVTHQLSSTDCHRPIVTNQLSSTDCHQPTEQIVTNALSPTNCHQPIATHQMPPTNLLPPNCHQPICVCAAVVAVLVFSRGRMYAPVLPRCRWASAAVPL